MCRRRPSKLSSPAAANVLALTARSSVRASRQDAPTSHPRRPSATPLRAERGAVRARVGAAARGRRGRDGSAARGPSDRSRRRPPGRRGRAGAARPRRRARTDSPRAGPREVSPHVRPKSQRGASMAACGPSPRSTTRVTSAACVWGCPSPPIVPYTKRGRPPTQVHGRDERVRGALARRQVVGMARIQREVRAAVLQQHAGVAGHHAGAELVIEALDHRDRVAVRHRRSRSRSCRRRRPRPSTGRAARREMSARRRARRSGSRQRATGHVDDGRIGEIPVAVLQRELGRFDGQVHVIGVGRAPRRRSLRAARGC